MPVSVKGQSKFYEAQLILDTGASKTVLVPELISGIGYRTSEITGHRSLTTANGIVDADEYKMQSFKAIGLIRQNFEVVCHPLPLAFAAHGIQGLLGLDFIYNRELTINMPYKYLKLETV